MSVRNTPENDRSLHDPSHYTEKRCDDLGYGLESLGWRLSCGLILCHGRHASGRGCRRTARFRVDGFWCCEIHHPDAVAARHQYRAESLATADLATQKALARSRVGDAVRVGLLVRQPCRIGIDCLGSIEAHHPDYSKPLAVVWLCRRHHQLVHRKSGRSA